MKYQYKGKKWAVLGYGMEGMDAIDHLIGKGVEKITVYDQKEYRDIKINNLHERKCKFICGSKYLNEGLAGYDYIIRSPGFYRYMPQIVNAEKSGSVITSTTQIFLDTFKGKTIGVTGTKGKGTTSSLIYKILKTDGYEVVLLGNIGAPLLNNIDKLTEKSWAVLELSSFQLIDINISPHISVILNITIDHMDWHKDRSEYVEAKKNILKYQKNDDIAICNIDYSTSRSFMRIGAGRKYGFSVKKHIDGAYLNKSILQLKNDNKIIEIGDLDNLILRGKHNWENVTAASIAAYLAGASVKSIMKTIFNFKGLEHRLEFVDEIKRVKYFDDSFSTNPQTTLAAVRSFSEPLTIIIGGFDKGLDYSNMTKEFSKFKHIINVLLIGDIAEKLGNELKLAKFRGNVIFLGHAKMADIVKICIEKSVPGGVVLLSPASSSFDMFKDYKDRGDQFKKTVLKMK